MIKLLSSLRTSLQHGVRRNRAKYRLRTVQHLERQERPSEEFTVQTLVE